MKKNLEQEEKELERVITKMGSKITVVPVDKICYIEAQDDYVMIYTAEGKYLKQQTMKYFEKHLDGEQFVRVHRSYIANISCIERIEPYEKTNYILILKDGNKVPVSRNGMQTLKENLDF